MNRGVWLMIVEHARGRETPLFDFLIEHPEHLKDVQEIYKRLWRREYPLWASLKRMHNQMVDWDVEYPNRKRMIRRRKRLNRAMERLNQLYTQVEVALGVPQDADIPF